VTKPLAEWLESLRAKKQTMKTRRIKELRVEAVLNKAQAQAGTLLGMKRQKRAETISAQIRQDEPTPDY
jgi:hypothetical protein